MNKWVKLLQRPLAAALGAALVVSVALAARASEGAPGQPGEPAETARVADPYKGIPQHGIDLGDPKAPVTIVEIADLQCPFCRSFTVDTLPLLVERYVRPGRVRIRFYALPVLGQDSERAARAVYAAALQDRLFPFVDAFFHAQGREQSGYVTDTFLRGIGARVRGLDVERAMAERDSRLVTDQIAEASRMASDLHLRGVPAFLLGRTGGEMKLSNVVAGQPETFVVAIEALLAKE